MGSGVTAVLPSIMKNNPESSRIDLADLIKNAPS